MTEVLIERANQLIQLSRFAEAERELRNVLATDPTHGHALALFALCLGEQGRIDDAVQTIKIAIGRAPDNHFYLYLYSQFLFREDKLPEAEKMISNAIAFEPENPDYFGLLASIALNQKQWQAALENANKGLALDPDNLSCLNVRSTALIKLNKKEEAYSTIEKALMNDPQNESTHANLGWGLLEKGDHKKALDHFKTSLKINPDNAYAKAGLVEGLKARYLFYRIFLKYAFWLSNMKSKGQWMVILGLYFGVKILQAVSSGNPGLAMIITPLIYLYIIFAATTWIIGPLSNLFLRLNVYGRYALDDDDIESSNYVGLALCVGLAGGLLYLFDQDTLYLMILIYGISMMIPLASMFNPQKSNSRQILILYAIGMSMLGAGAIAQFVVSGEVGFLAPVYVLGIVAYGWIANAIMIR